MIGFSIWLVVGSLVNVVCRVVICSVLIIVRLLVVRLVGMVYVWVCGIKFSKFWFVLLLCSSCCFFFRLRLNSRWLLICECSCDILFSVCFEIFI